MAAFWASNSLTDAILGISRWDAEAEIYHRKRQIRYSVISGVSHPVLAPDRGKPRVKPLLQADGGT